MLRAIVGFVNSISLNVSTDAVCRFRNLEYLESELQTYYDAEQKKMEAQETRLKKMQKRLA